MPRASRATERESHSHNPFDFGVQFRFDAATVTKIKTLPGLCKGIEYQLYHLELKTDGNRGSGYKYRCGTICFGVEALLHNKWIAAFSPLL
jgi:hypothetical protein